MPEVESTSTLLDKINSLGVVASRISDNINQDALADIYIPIVDREGESFSKTNEENYDPKLFYPKMSKMIPPALLKDFTKEGSYEFSIRGIFPEIHHAWITFDHQLILWNYLGEARSYLQFDQLTQIIVSVGLVKPKPDVFVEEVEYILVIATPVECIILAVVFDENNELSLLPTQLAVSTDNVTMLQIAGTDTGRVFMCGRDGHMYELAYQAEDGWFTKKCRKLNHTQPVISGYIPAFLKITGEDPLIDMTIDNTRKLLYALSAKSTIYVFSLGSNGQGFKKIASINNIKSKIFRLWREAQQYLSPNLYNVISISAILENDSSLLHLLAVTASGFRLYFTTLSRRSLIKAIQTGEKRNMTPSTLELVHVQAPPRKPGGDTRNPYNDYGEIHSVFYSQGVCVMAETTQQQEVLLICTAADLTQGAYDSELLPEKVSFITLKDGPVVWGVTCTHPQRLLEPRTSELANQHKLPALGVLCLTNQRLSAITKRRPVDQLYELLAKSHGNLGGDLEAFVKRYGADQTCAMCVLIISAFQGRTLKNITPEDLTKDFTPHLIGGIPIDGSRSEHVSSLAEQCFFKYCTPKQIGASVKFQAVSLYVARVLAPIWDKPIFSFPDSEDFSELKEDRFIDTLICSNIAPAESEAIQDLLNRVHKYFLPKLVRTVSTPPRLATGQTPRVPRPQDEPSKQEDKLLNDLNVLTQRAIEGLALVELIHEQSQQETDSYLQIPLHLKFQSTDLSFRDLISSEKGVQVAGGLINSLINHFSDPDSELAVNELSSVLEARCSTFFSRTYISQFQVLERLKKLANAGQVQKSELEQIVDELLPIAGAVDLHPIFQQFSMLAYYEAIPRLALARAKILDPDQSALFWEKSHRPPQDEKGKRAYSLRMDCYDTIIRTLDYLLQSMIPYDLDSGDDQSYYQQMIYSSIRQHDDELFHWAIFDWYLKHLSNKSITDKTEFLQLPSKYLESFLSGYNMEMLYDFYVLRSRYTDAARVANDLANRPGISIHRRIEHLADTINCAQQAKSSNNVQEYSDRMDVAQVQLSIFNQINALEFPMESAHLKRAALEELHRSLLPLNELWTKFAHRFSLWQAQLLIFHCARKSDPPRVKNAWINFINHNQEYAAQNLDALRMNVIAFGKQIYPSEWAFPVDDICRMLEDINSNTYAPEDPQFPWVVQTMLEIGVSFLKLFEVYHRMWAEKKKQPSELYVATVPLVYLFEEWSHSDDWGADNVPVLSDALTEYTTALDSRPEPLATYLKNKLHAARHQLDFPSSAMQLQ